MASFPLCFSLSEDGQLSFVLNLSEDGQLSFVLNLSEDGQAKPQRVGNVNRNALQYICLSQVQLDGTVYTLCHK